MKIKIVFFISILTAARVFGFISNDYQIKNNALSSGGGKVETETFYLNTALGQTAVDTVTSRNYVARLGYFYTITVDTTPPQTTIVVSEPKFDAFGTHYISPKTEISFSVVDPEVNWYASGVRNTVFRVKGQGLSEEWKTFTEPFTLSEGTHTIYYYSIDNIGNKEPEKEYKLQVVILPDYTVTGIDGVKVSGQGKVIGDVRSGSTLKLNGNAAIYGSVFAPKIELTKGATVTGTINISTETVHPYPIDLAPIIDYVSVNNDNSKIPLTQKGKNAINKEGELKLKDEDTLTLSSGTYYLQGLEIEGKAELRITGDVRVLCSGEVEVEGEAQINYNNNPYETVVFVSSYYPSPQPSPRWGEGVLGGEGDKDDDKDDDKDEDNDDKSEIKLSGKAKANLLIYAPFSEAELSGNSQFTGNVFAKQVSVSGNSSASRGIQVIVSTATARDDDDKEKKKASVIASDVPDPTFKLGNIYSYPNPATGGYNPTLHIETGVADRVEIKIFNIAAELVHSVEISGADTRIKNNKYCYEHEWNSTNNNGQPVASGIYIFAVTAYPPANAQGYPPIKTLNKLAVIK